MCEIAKRGRVSMDFDRLSSKYFGATAREYDSHRLGPKWMAEQQAVEEFLQKVPEGSTVLDAPTGTGRLIPLLASRSFAVHGVDVSTDMLSEANQRAKQSGVRVHLQQADVRHIPFPDGNFNLVICLRFMNWVNEEGVAAVVKELSRVSDAKLLIGIRYLTPTKELNRSGADLLRRAAKFFRLPSMRARRWGIILHKKEFIEALFKDNGLTIVERRMIERRWDATDYVFYWLAKVGHA